jgi:hypothetical protein
MTVYESPISIATVLNEAIGETMAKVDSKLIELVLKFAKNKPNIAIGNAKAKLDTKLKN